MSWRAIIIFGWREKMCHSGSSFAAVKSDDETKYCQMYRIHTVKGKTGSRSHVVVVFLLIMGIHRLVQFASRNCIRLGDYLQIYPDEKSPPCNKTKQRLTLNLTTLPTSVSSYTTSTPSTSSNSRMPSSSPKPVSLGRETDFQGKSLIVRCRLFGFFLESGLTVSFFRFMPDPFIRLEECIPKDVGNV